MERQSRTSASGHLDIQHISIIVNMDNEGFLMENQKYLVKECFVCGLVGRYIDMHNRNSKKPVCHLCFINRHDTSFFEELDICQE